MEKANNPPKDHYYDVIVQFMNGMTYVFFTILIYRARLRSYFTMVILH